MKLTNELIRKARPGDTLRDGAVQGLHLRCTATRKAFYLFFRTKAGRQRRPKLGDHPTMSLDQARAVARQMLLEVAAGRDPIAERESERGAPTMDKLCDRYLRDHAAKRKSAAEKERIVDKYIRPKLKRKLVSEVGYDDVYRIHHGLESAPIQANRVLAELSKMFSLAERWGWRPSHSNPCAHVERYKERKRRRYMTSTEAMKIADALREAEGREPASVAFIYLLILTGARKGEIAGATWDQVREGKIVLERHKTDSAGHDRVVYLPPQVLALLERLPKDKKTITGIQDPKKLWHAIRQKAGCPDLRLHDLRHSFASAALAAGLTLSQIGELLGHRSTQTTARYAHLIEDAAHTAVGVTADYVERMMGVKQPAD